MNAFDPLLDFQNWPAAWPQDPDVTVERFVLTEPWNGDRPLGHLSEAAFERVLAHEGLWIDGRPYGLQSALKADRGANVRIYAFESEPAPLHGPIPVLWKGENAMALLKPAGLSVGRTRAASDRCLESLVCATHGEDWRAVHRLDRDTSGVILFSEGKQATARLHAAFRQDRVDKRYWALVSPAPSASDFEVEGFLARATPPSPDPAPLTFVLWPTEAACPPDRDHSWSRTAFAIKAANSDRALLEAHLFTGRTHQIRVHLQTMGCSILGDRLYGQIPAPRLMLHARSICITGDFALEVCADPDCLGSKPACEM